MASYASTLPPPTPWQRLTRMLDTERKTIRHIIWYAVVAGVVSLSLPLGTQAVFNLVSTGAVFGSTYLLIAVVVGGVLLASILLIGQLTMVEAIEQRIFAKAAIEFAYRLPRIKPEALEGQNPRELVNRFFDVLTVQKGLTKLLIDLVFAGMQILFGVLVLAFYHPIFIALGLFTIIALVLIYAVNYQRALRTSIAESAYKYELVDWLEQVAERLPDMRADHTQSDDALTRADELTANYLHARNAHFQVLKTFYGYGTALRTLLTASLLIAGTLFVVSRQMTLGQFVAAEVLIVQISASIEKLMTGVSTIFDILTGVEKMAAVTDLPLDPHHAAISHA
ncbi:ABC transporter ATP-binding protein [Hymenobacter convexus]|uniref:ABC transporter ATP-binding protein n=1 Tax=Hymenobacter sp. CA1UV-4 TaxID=3063782 RepID=UPI002713A5F4|nr:ABC transporter ATP-binding protein [Hymenobacter sp. CA1UV-4]MDO7850840.1 ABC transporter ATP-binding protein [Hymenobacter sp. CA1UV-4]